MTKTQANEPGFVLVPREIMRAIAEGYHAKGADDRYVIVQNPESCAENGVMPNLVFDISAPIVPAPAYEVKEALEPLARLGGHLSDRDREAGLIHRAAFWDCPADLVLFEDRMGASITVGDVRRARTAYDALSSAPVEEADAKAGEPIGYLSRAVLSVFDPNGTYIANAMLYPKGTLRPHNEVAVYAAPSTPSPQPGEAPVGPVGEAVAWGYFTRTGELICTNSEEMLRKSYPAEQVGPLYRHPAARPVEEPGEVERLVEETGSSSVDDLRDMALVGHSLMEVIGIATADGPYKDWAPAENPTEIVIDLINDLEEAITRAERAEQFQRANGTARQAAEASLAETRERLEQMTTERDNALAAAKMLTGSLSSAHAETRKLLRKIDAQEVGR